MAEMSAEPPSGPTNKRPICIVMQPTAGVGPQRVMPRVACMFGLTEPAENAGRSQLVLRSVCVTETLSRHIMRAGVTNRIVAGNFGKTIQ